MANRRNGHMDRKLHECMHKGSKCVCMYMCMYVWIEGMKQAKRLLCLNVVALLL